MVVLTTYGSLFFASAPVFEGQLPKATSSSHNAVVVVRLRGKEDLGSTFISVISRYHDALRASGAHLILAGVGDRVARQLRDTGAVELIGQDNIFGATESVGESLNQALQRAEQLRVGGGDSGEKDLSLATAEDRGDGRGDHGDPHRYEDSLHEAVAGRVVETLPDPGPR